MIESSQTELLFVKTSECWRDVLIRMMHSVFLIGSRINFGITNVLVSPMPEFMDRL